MKRALAVMVVLGLVACDADFVPLAGGALTGRLTPPPGDWTEIARPEIIRLETNPAKPYSVKLWVVGQGSNLYVHAGANRAAWIEHMDADPGVKVLIGEALYELSARRVTSQSEFDEFAAAYEAKYGNRPRNEKVNEAYLYRLVPRNN